MARWLTSVAMARWLTMQGQLFHT